VFDALGSFSASSCGMEAGSVAIWEATAAAPDDKVVTRKTCRTWNTKYHFSTRSSADVLVGSPKALKMSTPVRSRSMFKGHFETHI
jgi:hypothetical protein